MLDAPFADIVIKLKPNIPSVKTFIVLASRERMPSAASGSITEDAPAWLCYDELLQAEMRHLDGFTWTAVHEDTACGLCFTSGTTGRPKVCVHVCKCR